MLLANEAMSAQAGASTQKKLSLKEQIRLLDNALFNKQLNNYIGYLDKRYHFMNSDFIKNRY